MLKQQFRSALAVATLPVATLGLSAAPAQAAVEYIATYVGNDCVGGFSTCYATQNGVVQGPVDDGSPAIFKYGSDRTVANPDDFSSLFPSITGAEFVVTLDTVLNKLSFTYAPDDAADPVIHYFTVKQANGHALFYDADPITSGTILLGDYFRQPGFSHITFFDTGSVVPEPATWAMMMLGFGFLGAAMRSARRRQKLSVSYT